MGAAKYNRGTQVIRKVIDIEMRPVEFEIMERLNAIPKNKDAGTPFSTVQLIPGNNWFWIVCPDTGFGFWYKTLSEAVRRWRVTITGYDCGKWLAEPQPRAHSLLR